MEKQRERQLKQAFNEGFDAWVFGMLPEDCPYEDAELELEWLGGYDMANNRENNRRKHANS